MPDDKPISTFASAARQVNARENSFSLGIITRTAGAAEGLRALFNSDIPVQTKSDISTALHGLDAFIATLPDAASITVLGNLNEAHLLAYIQSIPAHRTQKRERDRRVLRKFFTEMVTRGVITAAQHPIPVYKGGITPKAEIDAFWGEKDSNEHRAIARLFDEKHPRWNDLSLSRSERGRLHYVTAASRFATYAKQHGVMRAEDVTKEFAQQYLMTFKQGDRKISPRRQTHMFLRHIFERRMAQNSPQAPNPFLSNMVQSQKEELLVVNALYLARGSDTAAGTQSIIADKVKQYIITESDGNSQVMPAIDQFCFWAIHWRGRDRFEAITRDDVLTYWATILGNRPERTQRNYFSPVISLLRYLQRPDANGHALSFTEGAFINYAIHTDKRKRKAKKPSPFARVTFSDIWGFYRKQDPSQINRGTTRITDRYMLDQMSQLGFASQVHLAAFAESYRRCKIPVKKLVPGYSLIPIHRPGDRAEMGHSYVKAGLKAGLTILHDNKSKLSKEFVDLLLAPDNCLFAWSMQVQAEQKRRIQLKAKKMLKHLKL